MSPAENEAGEWSQPVTVSIREQWKLDKAPLPRPRGLAGAAWGEAVCSPPSGSKRLSSPEGLIKMRHFSPEARSVNSV